MAAQRRVMTARVEQVLLSNWAAVGPNWIGKKVREDIRRRHLQLCLGIERTRRFASPAREAQYRALYPPLLSPSVPGWSVELRRPFADRRLHEFMLAVPPEQHFQPHPEVDLFYAGSKRLLRSAMRGVLTEPVRLRTTKTAFGGIYVDDVRQRWPQYEAAFGPSATPIVAERGYVDRRQFWSRLEQLREGAVGADFIYILHIVGLESWLRGFNQPRHQLVAVPVASADSSVIEPARERR
jgi:asparagine synthase (glutamine-hydrolysing)